MRRPELLEHLVDRVAALPGAGPWLVGIDGVDGSGKTVLAGELVAALRDHGARATGVSLDGFHRPRAERYRKGRDSPVGFLEDSYDDDAFLAAVVEPVRAGGGTVRTAAFDHRTDARVAGEAVPVGPGDVVVVDGVFLRRPVLASAWSLHVWLEVPFEVTFPRMAVRDGCPADPGDPANRRYVEGQRLYLARCEPARWADVVVDNTDPAAPVLVRG